MVPVLSVPIQRLAGCPARPGGAPRVRAGEGLGRGSAAAQFSAKFVLIRHHFVLFRHLLAAYRAFWSPQAGCPGRAALALPCGLPWAGPRGPAGRHRLLVHIGRVSRCLAACVSATLTGNTKPQWICANVSSPSASSSHVCSSFSLRLLRCGGRSCGPPSHCRTTCHRITVSPFFSR